jgi:hypothetical protein
MGKVAMCVCACVRVMVTGKTEMQVGLTRRLPTWEQAAQLLPELQQAPQETNIYVCCLQMPK